MAKRQIGEILKDAHAVSEEDLRKALEVHRATGERLGGALLRLRMVDSSILVKALGEQQAVEGVDLDQVKPTAEALALLSGEDALQMGCLPLWREKNTLAVVAADPRDDSITERIGQLTKLTPKTFIAPQSAIYKAIKTYYDINDSLPKVERVRALLKQLKKAIEEIEGLLAE